MASTTADVSTITVDDHNQPRSTLVHPPLRTSSLPPPPHRQTPQPRSPHLTVPLRIDTTILSRLESSTPPPVYTTPSYEAYCETAFKLSQPTPKPPQRHLLRAVFILRCILDFQLITFSAVVFILGMLSVAASLFITKTYDSVMNIVVTFLIASTVFVPLTERYLVSKNHTYECYGFEEAVDAPEVAMTAIWSFVAGLSLLSMFSDGTRWFNVGWEGAGLSVLYLSSSVVNSLGRVVCVKYYGVEEGDGGLRLDDDDHV